MSTGGTGNPGIRFIDGGVGTDTVDYDGYAWSAVTANLATGVVSGGGAGGVGSATLVSIERFVGGDYNDSITGSGVANELFGAGGNDTIDGGGGADTLRGGVGDDTYIVNDAAASVVENAGEGIDTVLTSVGLTLADNVENLTATGSAAVSLVGNNATNVIHGNDADNYILGRAGDDTMYGHGGNDNFDMSTGGTGNTGTRFIDGGDGTDTVDYDGYAWSAVTANLATGAVTGGGIGGVGSATLVSIERFVGGDYNDSITGSSGANELFGAGGNDTIDGGGGADTLHGGTGSDTYVLGRGYGSDLIQENDATAGNTDVAQFGSDVARDQLWFQQSGNNLVVSIIGTPDQFTVQDWYLGSQYQVEQFKTAGGSTLVEAQVQNLVNAMASFSPPAAGQTTLPSDYAQQLNPVIAANWS